MPMKIRMLQINVRIIRLLIPPLLLDWTPYFLNDRLKFPCSSQEKWQGPKVSLVRQHYFQRTTLQNYVYVSAVKLANVYEVFMVGRFMSFDAPYESNCWAI